MIYTLRPVQSLGISHHHSDIQFLSDPLNGNVDRAVISDGNAIISETNSTLLSLKSEIHSFAQVAGVEERMTMLGNVNISFQSVVNEHHNALRKYLSDVEQALGRDIRSRSPNASEADINAALGNAVGYARSSNFPHSVIVVEAGNAYTNGIGKELLPKYPQLIHLADSLDALLQSIAFYNTNVQFVIGCSVGDRVVQDRGFGARRAAVSLIVVIVAIIVIASAISAYNRRRRSYD